ncbi:peroxidase 44-like [Miscanthus floridulus]|uniref:peroxidase 44-like n=1 Tax=Miscanthus floridulus TaxID=154761 RepID=UPI0034579F4A
MRAQVQCSALELTARDAVALLSGTRYGIAVGRRDGTVSNPWEVDLPAPFAKLGDVLGYLAARGFSAKETVVLFSGTHCSSFRYSLTRPDSGTTDETPPRHARRLLCRGPAAGHELR